MPTRSRQPLVRPPAYQPSRVMDVGHNRQRLMQTIESQKQTSSLGATIRQLSLAGEAYLRPWKQLSEFSWNKRVFLALAVCQASVVVGLQTAALVGPSRSGLVADKRSYAIFYMGLSLYSLVLALKAVFVNSALRVMAVLIMSVLNVVAACIQVYQYVDTNDSSSFGIQEYLAIASLIVTILFAMAFSVLFYLLFIELGRQLYEHIGADLVVRDVYSSFENMTTAVSVLNALLSLFLVTHVAVLVDTSSYEFIPSVAFLALHNIMTLFAVRAAEKEHTVPLYLYFALLFVDIAYFFLKVYSFDSKNCSFCKDDTDGNFAFITLFALVNLMATLGALAATYKLIKVFGLNLPAIVRTAKHVKNLPYQQRKAFQQALVSMSDKRQMRLTALAPSKSSSASVGRFSGRYRMQSTSVSKPTEDAMDAIHAKYRVRRVSGHARRQVSLPVRFEDDPYGLGPLPPFMEDPFPSPGTVLQLADYSSTASMAPSTSSRTASAGICLPNSIFLEIAETQDL